VVPLFNEANAIAGVLDHLAKGLPALPCPWEIIVVDDGATDGSAEKIDPGRFLLVRHETNRGYGASLKTGARHARYDLIALIDADGTYPAERIPELVRQCEDYDMAVGARTGKNANVPLVRRPAKWILNTLDYISGPPFPI
jgi:glycosyltransferase involved in cell wall biosynthesis